MESDVRGVAGVVVRGRFYGVRDAHARCSQICPALGMLERMERGGAEGG